MMTHKITLPDGTVIEIFTNADEVEGAAAIDHQALFNKARRQVKQQQKNRRKRAQKREKCARRKQR